MKTYKAFFLDINGIKDIEDYETEAEAKQSAEDRHTYNNRSEDDLNDQSSYCYTTEKCTDEDVPETDYIEICIN